MYGENLFGHKIETKKLVVFTNTCLGAFDSRLFFGFLDILFKQIVWILLGLISKIAALVSWDRRTWLRCHEHFWSSLGNDGWADVLPCLSCPVHAVSSSWVLSVPSFRETKAIILLHHPLCPSFVHVVLERFSQSYID